MFLSLPISISITSAHCGSGNILSPSDRTCIYVCLTVCLSTPVGKTIGCACCLYYSLHEYAQIIYVTWTYVLFACIRSIYPSVDVPISTCLCLWKQQTLCVLVSNSIHMSIILYLCHKYGRLFLKRRSTTSDFFKRITIILPRPWTPNLGGKQCGSTRACTAQKKSEWCKISNILKSLKKVFFKTANRK